MASLRVAVVGAGGVGGYFGGRLAAAGAHVSFVARGAHLDALRSRGLTIRSCKGDLHLPHVHATDDPAAIGPVDIVFFTVKLYDAEAGAHLLIPLVGADTAVIPLQNGVDGVDIVAGAVGRPHTAGGTVYVAAVVDEPGVIRHSALDHLIFGELDGTRTPRLERLFDVCRPAGFQTTLSDNVQVDIWTKFVRLSVFSGMTAVTRCPIGPIVGDPELFEMVKAAARETMAVARAKGVAVPDTVIDDVDRAYRALPKHMKSSMLEDLERGRRLELPWLSGAVVRLGREVGIDTPTHRFIAAVLNPHVNGSPTPAETVQESVPIQP
ncbi:MAG: 2-dehydropantoate 2-reductase [Acidobacteria bacterium]|nr:MAG: 2-dehydropantoate 2-reductase [Acidobacteriota bacterium]